MKISCLLLAAGDSSRVKGKNKLTLKADGHSLVRKTLQEIQKAPIQEVVVVTGFEQDKIALALEGLQYTQAINNQHEVGMHSSIKTGLKALKNSCDAFFICLADQPYFDVKNLLGLMGAYEEKSSFKIFSPTYMGKRGHPVLIDSTFIPEILKEIDGDYGLSYLLKRYPQFVKSIPLNSQDVVIDIDEPLDYEKVINNSYASIDPVREFHENAAKLRADRIPYVVATVIEVMGSASAKTGSKALFSQEGKNLLGWVGGGCAERFIGEQSVEAIKERKTRIVLADLDDEIFGLGVACGGKMRVFLDPILPSETIHLAPSEKFSNEIRIMSGFYGWNVIKDHSLPDIKAPEVLLRKMAEAVASKRNRTLKSMRIIKEVPAKFLNPKVTASTLVTIVGSTRITEALARHFALLNFDIRIIGPELRSEDYPSSVQCHCLDDSYASIKFHSNEIVIIAGHTSQDPQLVANAIEAKASYVGMIGSYKRSIEVLTHMNLLNLEVVSPLYIPAGLDLDAQNPDEIALSVIAEVITEMER